MSENCGTCRFWKARGGMCRRFPPVIFYDITVCTRVTQHPTTNSSQWCGEFVSTPEKHVPVSPAKPSGGPPTTPQTQHYDGKEGA